MAAPSQRRALGALFLVLTLFFAGVAVEAATHVWPVAAAAGVLALWMASLTWQLLRRR